MNDSLSATLTHWVNVKPIDRTFEVQQDDTILAAALKSGCQLPYSCQNGICGTCRAKVLDGVVDHAGSSMAILSNEDRQQGYALLCQAKALTALTIACEVVEATQDIPIRRLVSRVDRLERLAEDVMRIRLRLPAKESFRFLPGQYINVVMPGGIRRSLSLANVPDDNVLELHLRNYGGPFSQHVFNVMKENDLVRLEGPLGTFFVREDSSKPMVFVASGTGFAPIKAMIERELEKASSREITLYWGGRRASDLYLSSVAEAWTKSHNVTFIPVLSEAHPDDLWEGRVGFVHRAVMEDYEDLSQHQVYACGAPVVVQSARQDFVTLRNLPEEEFFADMFVSGQKTPQ